MSKYTVKFIPADATYAPDYLEARQGVALLQKLVAADAPERVSFKIFPNPGFIDNGENLESIHCPLCGEYVSNAWWSDAVGDAYRDDFWTLDVEMPCCGAAASLNGLKYDLHVGFARFVLEVEDPKAPVGEAVVEALSALYGQPFRMVPTRS